MDASKREKTNMLTAKAIIKIQGQEKKNNQMTTQDWTVKKKKNSEH